MFEGRGESRNLVSDREQVRFWEHQENQIARVVHFVEGGSQILVTRVHTRRDACLASK